jgi:WD40 repeat protein
MALQIRCPKCGRTSHVDEARLGQEILCSQCRSRLALPTGPARKSPSPADPGAHATTAMAPPRIGRFEVRGELGSGAFGTVYRAYDPQLDREVALKVPNPGMLGGARAVERFLREARAAARLRHPHIVPVHDAGHDGSRHYIASAFIAGRTLEEISGERPLPFRAAARVVRDLAEALAYAHGLGIVHRDVKPANILVDERGQAHLMDFGLAHLQDAAERLTYDGAVLGTPAYIAPEQAAGAGREPLPASDQYSLGVVLYELLCGEVPFSGPAPLVVSQHAHTEPPRPSARNAKVPRDLETICLKALAKEPGRRYAGCQELADDLRRWLEGEPIQARRLGSLERLARWTRRRPALTAVYVLLALTLLLGAGVAGAVRLWQDAEQARRKTDEALAGEQEARRETVAALDREKLARQETDKALDREKQARRAADAALTGEQQARQETAAALEREKQARQEADKALAGEQQARREAAAALDRLQQAQLSYLRTVTSAHQAWQANKMSETLALLQRCPEDLRHWEWRYLYRLCHADLMTFRGPQYRCVVFSPDGRRLAGSAEDNTVKVWDTQTGQEIRTFKGHTGGVHSVAFSPDGRRLASAAGDPTVKVWDVQTGKEVLTLRGHANGVNSVAYSPNGSRLATASWDQTMKIWDAQTGEVLTSRAYSGGFSALTYSPDGRHLAGCSGLGGDATVKVWDVQTGQEVLSFRSGSGHAVTYSPDGRRLAIVSGGGSAAIWDTAGKWILGIGEHPENVLSVAFSQDGRYVVSGSADGAVRLRDAQTGKAVRLLKGHSGGVGSVAISPDGRRLASASGDGVKLWDAQTDPQVLTVPAGSVLSLAFSPDGRLATGYPNGAVRLRDAPTYKEVNTFKWHDNEVLGLAFSPAGRHVASSSWDQTLRLWGAQTGGSLSGPLRWHGGAVHAVAYSPDGRQLASASGDGTVAVWDPHTYQVARTLKGHTHWVFGVVFSPDGRRLVSASEDQTVKVWDAQIGKELLTLKGHTKGVRAVVCSPDGRHLASASEDITVRVWELQTGREVFVLKGHTRPVRGVAYNRDGRRLASASEDGTVRVWDPQNGQQILTLTGFSEGVTCLAFSPDGHRLVCGSREGGLKVWDGTPRPGDLSR